MSHAPQKKSENFCICQLFDMLSCVLAAITLRVCRVYIEEGLYEVHVGLEEILRGLVRWIVILGKSRNHHANGGGLRYSYTNFRMPIDNTCI